MQEVEEGINLGDTTIHQYPQQQPVTASLANPAPTPQPNGFVKALLPFVLGAAVSGPVGGIVGYAMNKGTTNVSPNTNVSTQAGQPPNFQINSQPPAFKLEGAEIVTDTINPITNVPITNVPNINGPQ